MLFYSIRFESFLGHGFCLIRSWPQLFKRYSGIRQINRYLVDKSPKPIALSHQRKKEEWISHQNQLRESGWFSGHQPCLPPLWPRFNSGLGSYVGWVSVDLNLTLRVFLRVLRFSSLLKIDSRPMDKGHTWVVFRGRAPSRQHSSFGPTSLSCALSNSVSDCEKGRLADQIFLSSFFLSLR